MHDPSPNDKKEIELQLINSNPSDIDIPQEKQFNHASAKPPEPQSRYNKLGIYFTLLSVFSGVVVAVIWKWNPDLPSAEVITLRSIFVCIMSYYLLKKQREKSLQDLFSIQYIIIGIISSLSVVTYYLGLISLSVSEATTIYATLGIFNGIFGLLFLNETYPMIERLLGGACFIGVLLIVRPPFLFGEEKQSNDTEELFIPRYVAALIMTLSTLLWALTQIMIRKMKNGINSYSVIFQSSLTMTLFCICYMIMKGSFQTLTFAGYFTALLIASGSVYATYTIIKALEYEKPSVVGLFGYSEIIFAIIADVLIFHIFPSLLTTLGMTIIIASCLFLLKKAS